MSENQVSVHIDPDACIGQGRCVATYPELFRFDADKYGEVVEGVDIDVERAERAAILCPQSAITVDKR